MNFSPEILNELKEISPLLASLEKVNVFRVPDGYFDDLYKKIVHFTLYNIHTGVDDLNKRNVQQVPAGYFDSLSSSILAKVKAALPESATEELQELYPLLYDLRKKTIFSVPEGYFDTIAGNVQQMINASAAETAREELKNISTVLFELQNKNVFSVPAGYFDSFVASVQDMLLSENTGSENASEELRKLSPLLYSLQGENVFGVPRGYFESFAAGVTGSITPQQGKVITMKKKSSWFKYAAAAVVTGVIAVSSLQIFNNETDPGKSIVTESGLPAYVQASVQYKTEDDLNAGIAKLSDDDIIKYLEKNDNGMDNELLTNNTDVSEMPSQSDYLLDANTLNTYLDKIDAETTDKTKP